MGEMDKMKKEAEALKTQIEVGYKSNILGYWKHKDKMQHVIL